MDCRKRVGTRLDFLQYIETDVSVYIMSFLDDPADLVRAGAVSHFWRQFLIEHGLAKRLCLKKFLQNFNIAAISNASEKTHILMEPTEREILEGNQKIYSSLIEALTKSKVSPKNCIDRAISSSSTDKSGSRGDTLFPTDRFRSRASYWSSKGQPNPEAAETLTYKLKPGIWAITEIDIQPFEAFFQLGNPIYSAKSVRFRIGRTKSGVDIDANLRYMFNDDPTDDEFAWTYTSPEFPMMQENRLQPFKLPEPVLCARAYLQIELLGRVQRHPKDGLFYICVCYVRVLGRSLSPAFEIEMVEPHGNLLLKYYPDNLNSVMEDVGPVIDERAAFLDSLRMQDWPSHFLGDYYYSLRGFY